MATPEVSESPKDIEASRQVLVQAIQKSFPKVEQGWLIRSAERSRMEAALQKAFSGAKGSDLAAVVMGEGNPTAEGDHVKLQPLTAYPDDAPRSSVPPEIIDALGALPETLQYRFVSRNLLIHDTVSELILDFFPYAIPAAKP